MLIRSYGKNLYNVDHIAAFIVEDDGEGKGTFKIAVRYSNETVANGGIGTHLQQDVARQALERIGEAYAKGALYCDPFKDEE